MSLSKRYMEFKRDDSLRLFGVTSGLAFLIYFIFFGGHYVMGDHAVRMAWAKAMLDYGSHDISRWFPELRTSKYGIGQSLIHIPLLMLSRWIRALTGRSCEGPVNMLVYTVNSALGVGLMSLILKEVGLPARRACAGALLIGLSSFWFPLSKVEYGECLVATALLGAWYFADRSPLLCGLLIGTSITFRIDSVLWGFLLVVVRPNFLRTALKVSLGVVPGLVLTAWSNYVRTGNLFSSGYEAGFVNPIFVGIYGLLFSAGKSLFLFSPILILYPFTLRKSMRTPSLRSLAKWSLVLFLCQVLFYAKWWDWSGDHSWGVRFLVLSSVVGQLVVVASAFGSNRLLYPLVGAGFLVQLPAILMGPHTSLILSQKYLEEGCEIRGTCESPVSLDDIHFDARLGQVPASFELLFYKLTGHVVGNDSVYRTRSSNGSITPKPSWLGRFRPPPEHSRLNWDIFWLGLSRKTPEK